MLAVLLATVLSSGSAYADPDQPSTDPSGGTATGSTSQPAAGSRAGTGAVCTRQADAITSTRELLTSLQGVGDSVLSQQDAIIGAQLGAVNASDPAELARVQDEMTSMRNQTRKLMQDLADAQAAITRSVVENS